VKGPKLLTHFLEPALPKKRAITQFLSAAFLKLRVRERRLYRRQVKLRLPRTYVSRKRVRHAGRGLYASNSVRSPKSVIGRQAAFLPPKNVLSLSRALGRVEGRGSALRSTQQGDKNATRFRQRPL
jgi:hypothetical protein